MPTDKIVLLSSCAREEEAERLARRLVEERLAACVNLIPRARSYYRWQGALETADECLLVVKSSRELLPRLFARIQDLHSYEVPEALAFEVSAGAQKYLAWMEASLGGEGDPD